MESNNETTVALRLAVSEELEGDLKEIYDLVKIKVNLIISSGKFTPEHVRPLVLNIVEIIQNYSTKYDHIDGSEKKAMALNILRYVITDLYKNGQISQEHYETVVLSLDFLGGALIDFAKSAYKLLVEVIQTVSDSGCKGCLPRH